MTFPPLPAAPAAATVPVLPLARYRLTFTRSSPGGLPAFTGSAWRGALGHALMCLGPPADYREIFETPVPADAIKLSNYRDAPHPLPSHSSRAHDAIPQHAAPSFWAPAQTRTAPPGGKDHGP